MKGLTTEMKEQVRSALIAYRSNYPTLNRAAESLQGVSSATVSQLCNGKYELISDEMFIRIASQIGFAFDSWNLHEGKTFKEITFALSDAQAYKNVTWIVGDAGCGKPQQPLNTAVRTATCSTSSVRKICDAQTSFVR